MPTLSDPIFKIDPLTGTTYRVTAKITVELTPRELSLINPRSGRPGPSVQLKSNLWGYDGNDPGLGKDDKLFLFPTQKITRSATYTFSAEVPRSVLNEDATSVFSLDEIYNQFSLVSANTSLISNKERHSPMIRGYY